LPATISAAALVGFAAGIALGVTLASSDAGPGPGRRGRRGAPRPGRELKALAEDLLHAAREQLVTPTRTDRGGLAAAVARLRSFTEGLNGGRGG
jgi:hypothetical protein